ncbi:MAG: VWA domain-containing protein [Candidatus Aminicenantes bacterium]|nr:VWA domain-containing protein [Candidatus Aminicenantes bacterium]
MKRPPAVFLVLTALWAALILGFSSFLFSQEKEDKEIRYDIAVSAISIAVTVQDTKGRYINDLNVDDFTIYENDEKKSINYFSHDFDAPLSLTVLLDVSGSMALQDKLKESKEALAYLIEYLLDPQDEISLLIFADGEVEVASNFSKDKAEFLSILEKTEAYGQTALNDAVAVSPEFANKGANEKRTLLLITDGIENDSEYSPEQAIEVARRVDIPIYTIGYKIPLSEQYLKKYKRSPLVSPSSIAYSLKRFSYATGGKAFFLDEPGRMKLTLRRIVQETGHQYILGFTSYKDPNNDYRKIKVVTSKKKYKVRTREGYYSGEIKD